MVFEELKKNWLSMTKAQERVIHMTFGDRDVKAMRVKEEDCSIPKITSDGAEMSCTEVKTFTVYGEQGTELRLPAPQAFLFLFIKKDGRWYLDKRSDRPDPMFRAPTIREGPLPLRRS